MNDTTTYIILVIFPTVVTWSDNINAVLYDVHWWLLYM